MTILLARTIKKGDVMKNLATFGAAIALIILILGLMPVHGEAEIYDSVLRLHVLANSDSDEDQELKLKVRDAIISKSGELFSDCETRAEAISRAEENIQILKDAAIAVVRSEGYDYPVTIQICEEEYPTKKYESLCFPSGEYASLKVLIGEAEGQNWWCVLFPPLCLSAATEKNDAEEAFIAVGLTDEQYKIITESESSEYKVRFKILEALEALNRSE